MSKLEDKLAASLEPIKGKAPARKANPKAAGQVRAQAPVVPAAAEPMPVPAGQAKARAAIPNDTRQALHPDRIWPD